MRCWFRVRAEWWLAAALTFWCLMVARPGVQITPEQRAAWDRQADEAAAHGFVDVEYYFLRSLRETKEESDARVERARVVIAPTRQPELVLPSTPPPGGTDVLTTAPPTGPVPPCNPDDGLVNIPWGDGKHVSPLLVDKKSREPVIIIPMR